MKTSCFILIFVFILISCGCFYSGQSKIYPDQLPDQIYKMPRVNRYFGIKVGILEFESPEYAEGKGQLVAKLLYKELMKKNIYSAIQFYNKKMLPTRKNLVDFAKSEKLDLIIKGKLIYYLEGGNFQSSRVCAEIKCLEPFGQKFDTVWYALSCQKGEVSMPKYYIFFYHPGHPSDSGSELMQKIALGFANMLTSVPPIQTE